MAGSSGLDIWIAVGGNAETEEVVGKTLDASKKRRKMADETAAVVIGQRVV